MVFGVLHQERGIVFKGVGRDYDLISYYKFYYVQDRDHFNSTSDYVCNFGETVISLNQRLRIIVALSTTKAELIAKVKATQEAFYLEAAFE